MQAPQRDRIKLYEIMALIAGLAIGLWLVVPTSGGRGAFRGPELPLLAAYPLGGLSIAGIPLLLGERRSARRRPFGAGRFLWFAQGMTACLLWPPVIYLKAMYSDRQTESMSNMCFVYSSPLVSLFLLPSLWLGGWFGRRRRRRAGSWREHFGFWLTLAWAALGLYVLGYFYVVDFRS